MPHLILSAGIGWRRVTGRFVLGGTDSLWDTRVPIWARLFSCFHIGLPLALLWAMRKTGYDRRALALQAAIAAGAFLPPSFFSPGVHINHCDHRSRFSRSFEHGSREPPLDFLVGTA